MIDHNHPAVEAAARAECDTVGADWDDLTNQDKPLYRRIALHSLTAALPLLESATEDNLARLRDTPAGKQLLAEGWKRGYQDRQNDYGAADVTPNPYRT